MDNVKVVAMWTRLSASVNVNRMKDFAETKKNEMMMERQMMQNVKRLGVDGMAERIGVSPTAPLLRLQLWFHISSSTRYI